jgi:chromosome segregation ATPase
MEKMLDQILQELKKLNHKVDKIEAEQQIMKSDLQSVKTEQKSMKADMQSMKTEMQSMKADMLSMKEEQQFMKADMQSIKSRQQTMKDLLISQGDHIHQLIQIVGATNSRMNELANDVRQIKEDMVELKEVQQKQEKILERLAIRSISQEADIAELRRIK